MKKIAEIVFAGCLLFLSACSTTSSNVDPQTILNETAFAFSVAESAYSAICAINNPPGFCDSADYAKARAALNAAFTTARAAIQASGNINSSTIANVLDALATDWNTYNSIVNSVKAKKAAYDKARIG